MREIGAAATWSLSSCKSGFGIDQLRDYSQDTYWQYKAFFIALLPKREPERSSGTLRSDGPQPHTISLTFPKRTLIGQVSIYVDFKQDESYTPSKIAVRTGNNFSDLQDIHIEEMREPSGWIDIPLSFSQTQRDDDESFFFFQFFYSVIMLIHVVIRPVRTHLLQIAILANHQHGKDTHIRQLKVYAPRWSLS